MVPHHGRVDAYVEQKMDALAGDIESILQADVMAIIGPIYSPLDSMVRRGLESREGKKRSRLAIILDTNGGVIEVVDRMVQAIRVHYKEVTMIIPDKAMSAGTVFTMAGDNIMMDYYSCLGPIDPQVVKNNRLIPALSYLVQFERLILKSEKKKLTTAEVAMLQQLDLAELHSYEEARELSISLLKKWLTAYKFKDWKITEKRKIRVTPKMRQERAEQIAKQLMNHQQWHSHGRPISMEMLRKDLKLKIEDFGSNPDLAKSIRLYHQFLQDYIQKSTKALAIHSRNLFLAVG